MDSRTTQGTSSASMIILATVVFPDALPPPKPVEWKGTCSLFQLGWPCRLVPKVPSHTALTNGKGLLGLCTMFIVPWWTPSCVDGTFACAKQGWL